MIQNGILKNLIWQTGYTAGRLLYPPRCPICDALLPAWILPRKAQVMEWVCEDCRKKLPWAMEPACMKCGKPVGNPETEFCEDCLRTPHLYDSGRAAFVYTGGIRRSVYRMKFQNRRDYLDFYAAAMVFAGERYLRYWRPDVIVPVPMHWRKRAARGYNQAELLAEKISRLTGIPCDRGLLRCTRYTGNQKELDRKERLRNLRGSFETGKCRPDCSTAARALLVDDVYTTGSTMDEAARALREAGMRQIFFLVICTGKGKKSLHDTKSVLY
ncbi:MAG: ComF family protein [Lachnospiraceae bacterium]|nr:ComF family protein [Lachnospiraceae bacterium]